MWGHTAIIAGNAYAHGIEKAPGHVASARAEYRIISRAWYSFLGFSSSGCDTAKAWRGCTKIRVRVEKKKRE